MIGQASVEPYINEVVPEADRVSITYYTDPLCCWSWAIEPQWRKLQYEFHPYLEIRWVMSGLIPSWKNFNDPVFSVSKPMQMGPVWMEASVISGMPVQHKIWVTDPPQSSYPACIGVKAMELQDKSAATCYLRLLREAVMIHEQNIAKQDVLESVAEKVAQKIDGLDMDLFRSDLLNGRGMEAFRSDLNEVMIRNINRFPTLILRSKNSSPRMITGYNTYETLRKAMLSMLAVPEINTRGILQENKLLQCGTSTEREERELKNLFV